MRYMGTVLLCGQDAVIRDRVQDFLARCGYVVVAVSNVAVAMATFRTAPVDLVVVHTEGPDDVGAQVLGSLVREFANVRVVALSSFPEHLAYASAVGAELGLSKPFDLSELSTLVRPERAN